MNKPIKPGRYRNTVGDVVTVLRVFGRGRNRQVKIAEEFTPTGISRHYARVAWFRRHWFPVTDGAAHAP